MILDIYIYVPLKSPDYLRAENNLPNALKEVTGDSIPEIHISISGVLG